MESKINNTFYDDLGDEWTHRSDHPIALLRAENAIRNPWIAREIENRIGPSVNILDVGCGAGLLTNDLAQRGHRVWGIDLSEPSLAVAKKNDLTQSVDYSNANAYSLPFPSHSFHVVSAMDVLEHVEEPSLLIAEASRVLKPGGLFFFHTFNRNLLSYLLIIKGVDWFIPNAPRNMHVYPLFIRPQELTETCQLYDLNVVELRGLVPKLYSRGLLHLLFKRRISPHFTFQFTRSLKTGYCGIATKSA